MSLPRLDGWTAGRRRAPRALLTERRRRAGLDDATRRLLLGAVLPVWTGAGLADWWCHRRSDIANTAGTHEALMHLAMMGEAGAPTLLGLFAEVDAGVLALVVAAFGLHQATAIWDVAYADSRREVTPTEQHVHGLLEQAPAMATSVLLTLHWDQARSLLPFTRDSPRWRLQPKRRPLSPSARRAVLTSMTLFGFVPYVEEVARCRRAGAGVRIRPESGGQTRPARVGHGTVPQS